MDKETFISGIEHKTLLAEFIAFATREFGTINMNEIINKVNSSSKVSRFLIEARKINATLGSDDFLSCIHSSSSFIFSKSETIAVAGIALLMKWDFEIGKPNNLSDDIYLNERLVSILEKCNGLKTHINAAPNFFERFYEHLEKIVKLIAIKAFTQVDKTEISFDSVLCRAIKLGGKTEFRITNNLEVINLEANNWKFDGYEREKGAKFINITLGEVVLIQCPYKLGSTVNVLDLSDLNRVYTKVKIKTYYIQRIREVEQSDAVKEGYGAYVEKVNEIFNSDPRLDPEYVLFRENWVNIHSSVSFVRNEWLWSVGFEQITPSVDRLADIDNMSTETLVGILNAKI